VAPFVIALLIMIGLICVFPDLAKWLPRLVG
jgi:TRAP-type C4-dicarboxylate transport system permease large subunit